MTKELPIHKRLPRDSNEIVSRASQTVMHVKLPQLISPPYLAIPIYWQPRSREFPPSRLYVVTANNVRSTFIPLTGVN